MTSVIHKIGVLGDSVLKGVVLDEMRGTYRILADGCVQLVSRALRLDIVNKSRFGNTASKGSQALERVLDEQEPYDVVLLEFGGNDCDFDWPRVAEAPELPHQPRTPLKEFIQKMQGMIATLKARGVRPLIMSLPPICGIRYLDFLVDKGLSRERLMRFLGDVQQIYRFHEMYSLQVTSLALTTPGCLYAPVREAFLADGRGPALLCVDGIHPNEAGHRIMEGVFLQMAGTLLPEQV